MTRFLDGPAAETTLMLKRAPVFLRVVIDNSGEIDALDQLHDEPKRTETIHVYRLEGKPGMCHVLRRPKGSGFYTTATYRYFTPQPTDAECRTTAAWRAWTTQNANAHP